MQDQERIMLSPSTVEAMMRDAQAVTARVRDNLENLKNLNAVYSQRPRASRVKLSYAAEKFDRRFQTIAAVLDGEIAPLVPGQPIGKELDPQIQTSPRSAILALQRCLHLINTELADYDSNPTTIAGSRVMGLADVVEGAIKEFYS